MPIQKNQAVEIHYTLKNDNGDLIDTSKGKDPLSFIFGSGTIIPGLETELAKKSQGDSFTASIAPEDAYGVHNPEMIQSVPLDQFENKDEVEIGAQFHIPEQGIFATVTEINETDATLDMNHPLVGQTLHFDVSVESVRDANKEELDTES